MIDQYVYQISEQLRRMNFIQQERNELLKQLIDLLKKEAEKE